MGTVLCYLPRVGGDTACFVALILSNDCFATFDSFSDGSESLKLFLSLCRIKLSLLLQFFVCWLSCSRIEYLYKRNTSSKMLVNLLQRFLI